MGGLFFTRIKALLGLLRAMRYETKLRRETPDE